MRKAIVDSLTNVRVTNLDNFALISSALQEVSASEDEITEDSQVCMDRLQLVLVLSHQNNSKADY